MSLIDDSEDLLTSDSLTQDVMRIHDDLMSQFASIDDNSSISIDTLKSMFSPDYKIVNTVESDSGYLSCTGANFISYAGTMIKIISYHSTSGITESHMFMANVAIKYCETTEKYNLIASARL